MILFITFILMMLTTCLICDREIDQLKTSLGKECLKELGFQNPSDRFEPRLICLNDCLVRKWGWFNEKSELNEEAIGPLDLPTAKICAAKMKNDHRCVRANLLVECLEPETEKIRRKCADQTGKVKIFKGLIPLIDNDQPTCYHVCVFKAYNLVDDKDQVNQKTVKMFLMLPNIVGQLADYCSRVNKKFTGCDKTVKIFRCLSRYWLNNSL